MTTSSAQKRTTVIVVLCVIVLIGAGANSAFVIRSIANRNSDAQLFWSSDRAYLLIEMRRQWWRRRPVQFLGDVAQRTFGIGFAGPSPTDIHNGIVVITLSPSGVRKVEVDDLRSLAFGVVRDDVYAVTAAGLFRWAEDHFEKAPAGIERQDLSRTNFEHVNGWSGHSNVLTQPIGDTRFEMTLGGDRWTVIARNHSFPEEWKAVDVQRGDAPPENVWRVDERMRYVNAQDFDALLK